MGAGTPACLGPSLACSSLEADSDPCLVYRQVHWLGDKVMGMVGAEASWTCTCSTGREGQPSSSPCHTWGSWEPGGRGASGVSLILKTAVPTSREQLLSGQVWLMLLVHSAPPPTPAPRPAMFLDPVLPRAHRQGPQKPSASRRSPSGHGHGWSSLGARESCMGWKCWGEGEACRGRGTPCQGPLATGEVYVLLFHFPKVEESGSEHWSPGLRHAAVCG